MRMPVLAHRRAVAVVGAGAAVLAVVAVAPGANASPRAKAVPARHAVSGTAPLWLSHATRKGAVSSTATVRFGVLLAMRNQGAAVAKLQAISTPGSAEYGQWLTNKQFDASYAPTGTQVSAVQAWMRSQGFRVTTTFKSGMYIEGSGTAAQVEKTFGTQLSRFSYKGRTVRSNTGTLSLPAGTSATVTGAISGVLGIDQGSALKQPATTQLPGPPPGGRYGVEPCSRYYGQKIATDKPTAYGKHQPYAVCGYGPHRYQDAYGEQSLLKKGINGTGVTVAITDAYASPTMLKDANTYSKLHGEPVFTPGQYREVRPAKYNVYDPADAQGWYGEETLDVEAVHAMAPGAKIVFVSGSDDFTGLDDAWAQTIDDHRANIITNSWSDGIDSAKELGAAYIRFYNQFSLEGAMTGITDNFSTGDDGDETAGGTNPTAKTVGFPADEPWVTGVGGTSVEIGKTGKWLGEYGWSNAYSALSNGHWTPALPGSYSSGGGGGTSVLFKQPFYQRGGVVPSSLSQTNGGAPMRVIPDISMPGDPNTGMQVGETQKFGNGTYYAQYRIGGTSLSSPLLAGVIAVADQDAHKSLGFVNPLYYHLVGTPAVHDLVAPTKPVAQVRTNYTNGVNAVDGLSFLLQTIDDQSSTLHDTPGYDNETGVGSPGGLAFFSALAHGR